MTDYLKNNPLVAGIFVIGIAIGSSIQLPGDSQLNYFLLAVVLAPLVGALIFLAPKETRYFAMVFFLPFTQSLSIKFGARWKVSEILAWSLIPLLIVSTHRKSSRAKGTSQNLILLLFLYSLAVSIVSIVVIMPSYPWQESAIIFHYSPVIRTIVENARLLACVVGFLSPMWFIHNEQDFLKTLRVFGFSGFAASLYGLYQGVHILWARWLPLLPGTLERSNSTLRLWGSFYEPTGFGGFCVISSIVLMYLVVNDCRYKLLWLCALLVTITGLLFSVSTIAWLAGLVALCCLGVFAGFRRGGGRVAISVALVCLVVVVLLEFFGQILNLTELFWRNLAWSNIMHRTEPGLNMGDTMVKWLGIMPAGVGQGMLEFLEGGAAGIIRWTIEMGVFGIMLTLSLHWMLWRSIRRMFWQSGLIGAFAPFGLALYLGIVIVASRYIHPTHIWLWFGMGMPLLVYNFSVPGRLKPVNQEFLD